MKHSENGHEITDDMIRELCTITTRDEAGRRFYEPQVFSHYWQELEAAGLISIHRPVHDATGIPYDCQYHTLQVTEEGQQVVENNIELWPED